MSTERNDKVTLITDLEKATEAWLEGRMSEGNYQAIRNAYIAGNEGSLPVEEKPLASSLEQAVPKDFANLLDNISSWVTTSESPDFGQFGLFIPNRKADVRLEYFFIHLPSLEKYGHSNGVIYGHLGDDESLAIFRLVKPELDNILIVYNNKSNMSGIRLGFNRDRQPRGKWKLDKEDIQDDWRLDPRKTQTALENARNMSAQLLALTNSNLSILLDPAKHLEKLPEF